MSRINKNDWETRNSKAERFVRRMLLFMTGLLLIVVAGAALLASYRERAEEAEEFREIAALVVTPDLAVNLQTTPASIAQAEELQATLDPVCSPAQTVTEQENANVLNRFTELLTQNCDLGGWVKIDDTAIDYPVMFTPDEPERYIHLAFSKKKSMSGVPFIGEGGMIQPRSDNIVLYGHHMKNGTMFAVIVRYQDKEFWREHPVIHFSTLYDEGDYEIFAALETDIRAAKTLRCYTFINAKDEADFQDYLNGIRRAALYDTGIEVAYGDDLITLSTCAYHTNDGRFVIVARRKG